MPGAMEYWIFPNDFCYISSGLLKNILFYRTGNPIFGYHFKSQLILKKSPHFNKSPKKFSITMVHLFRAIYQIARIINWNAFMPISVHITLATFFIAEAKVRARNTKYLALSVNLSSIRQISSCSSRYESKYLWNRWTYFRFCSFCLLGSDWFRCARWTRFSVVPARSTNPFFSFLSPPLIFVRLFTSSTLCVVVARWTCAFCWKIRDISFGRNSW